VESDVIGLAGPRSGHFDLGTGYHGDLWLDLDALFLRPALLRPHVRWLSERLRKHRIDAVCGPADGGALLACSIAGELGTAFLAAYRGTTPAAYRLPAVQGGIGGWRVAIADDAVNAGTAVQACARQLRDAGATPVAVAALLAVGPAAITVETALSVPFYAAGSMSSQAWAAGQCPLCAAGSPLTRPPGG
jgi:orotate phosphoribosyltransferase